MINADRTAPLVHVVNHCFSDTWIVGNCGSVRHKTTMCQRLDNETEPITSPPPVPLGFCPEGYIGLGKSEHDHNLNTLIILKRQRKQNVYILKRLIDLFQMDRKSVTK